LSFVLQLFTQNHLILAHCKLLMVWKRGYRADAGFDCRNIVRNGRECWRNCAQWSFTELDIDRSHLCWRYR